MSQTDKPTLSLDLRGEHCPYNAIATLETLATMQPGERLEVVTDCSQSVHGIPEDTQRQGLQMPGGGAAWRAVPLPHRGAAGKLNERACNDKKADPRVGFLVPGFSAENCAAGAAGLPGW